MITRIDIVGGSTGQDYACSMGFSVLLKSSCSPSGCSTPLALISRTYKTRLLFHIPINLLEICANLSKQSSAAVLLWEGQTCYGGMGLADVETQSKEAMYDCFLVSTLSKSSSNLHYSRV